MLNNVAIKVIQFVEYFPDLATLLHGVTRCRELFGIFILIETKKNQINNKLNDTWYPMWPRTWEIKFHRRKVYIRKFEIKFGVAIKGNCFGFNISGLNECGRFWLNCENLNLVKIRELRINIFTVVLQPNLLLQKSM